MISQLIIIIVLSAPPFVSTAEPKCKSLEMAKAETYLETAASLIDRLRENLPEVSSNGDCSCPPKPMDCDEVLKCGHNRSGVYQIWPRNRIILGSINVFCDMETNGGGWTVFQKRGNFQRPKDFFNKTWHEYKTGFGDLRRDFWLGNENVYALTNQKKYYLRVDVVEFNNNSRYAFYDQFWIDSESQSFKLHVHDYSGDAGDALSRLYNGNLFSTNDRDNDESTSENCAVKFGGGWWYFSCILSNLNGIYNGPVLKNDAGVIWLNWKQDHASLQITEMKIRPVDFQTDLLDLDVEPA